MKQIIAISSYPGRHTTHGAKTVGIASYAKNTLKAISSVLPHQNITVLAEKLPHEVNYTHNTVSVKRIWKRNSLSTFYKLALYIFSNRKSISTVLVEFELSMFGSILHLLPLPLFLLFLKAINKRIVFVNHQVITDVKKIGPHMNLSIQSPLITLYDMGFALFYSYALLLTDTMVVFEEGLRSRLSKFGNIKKITYIPHGIESFKKIPSKNASRKVLKLDQKSFTVLCFGYLAWYKGTDWIIEAIEKLNLEKGQNIQLVLAGGPNPNHTKKEYYKKYIQSVENRCKENGFLITGFVDEKDIPHYYSAADVVVFPYRNFMSSSGPLSLAFSLQKPFLVAEALSGIFTSPDLAEALKFNGLTKDDVVFNDKNLGEKLLSLKRRKTLSEKIIRFSQYISLKRDWKNVGKQYADLFETSQENTQIVKLSQI